jgi:hypothetical protein
MAQRGTTAKIDLAELERLSAMQCTDEEIAAWFKVTTRTIERRRKNRSFAEVMDRGKAKGRISVRRAQLKLLDAGNATMGVWLGKNILGQVDEIRHDISGSITNSLSVVLPRMLESNTLAASGVTRQLIESGEHEHVGAEPTEQASRSRGERLNWPGTSTASGKNARPSAPALPTQARSWATCSPPRPRP